VCWSNRSRLSWASRASSSSSTGQRPSGKAPPEAIIVCTPLGEELRALAPLIASRRAGHAFLGYLQAQKQRLLGTRGQKRVRRPELVARDGYDSKYAMHLCRLGYQGLEFVQTGRLTLPMPEDPTNRPSRHGCSAPTAVSGPKRPTGR
jgi:hypothetical protein